MKNRNLILAILLIISPFFYINGQVPNTEDNIKENLNTIFKLSQVKDYEAAAKKFAYDGEDATRKLKDTFNYKDPKESNEVKRFCKKIKAYLDLSDSYEFGDFKAKNDNGDTNYTIKVNFISGQQSLTIEFKFVNANGKLLLADFK